MLYVVALIIFCVALAAIMAMVVEAQRAPEAKPVRVEVEIRPRR
jgi:hypothetical protein